MKTSIIVPAYNASQTLMQCLEALREQDIATLFEIIVVDDCSDDETAALATAPDITLIKHEGRRGAAAARNSGIRAAQGEICCFTDADCTPRSDWVRQILLPFDNEAISGCKGTYATNQEELVARFVQLEYEDKYDRLRGQKTINFIDTYSCAYRKDVLLTNDGFDEQFAYLEDQELSFRLATRGYDMIFQPEAVVYHYHSNSLAFYCRKKFTIGYWKAQVVRRFPDRAIQDSHTPQVMKVQMLLVALVLAAAAGLLISSWSGLLLAAATAVFLLSTLPFAAKAWRKDKVVALASPFLLFARALSLGVGYAWGLVKPAENIGQEDSIDGTGYVIKRLMDVSGAVVGLIFTAAAAVLIVPAIALDSRGPIIYKQERVGKEGKAFILYKFRSMHAGSDEGAGNISDPAGRQFGRTKPRNDPRRTRVGRFLRRWSLDELPQFWNVLKGDMSLVGPRPEETRYLKDYDDRQRRRLSVKPGITGPMQVSGRADLPLEERVDMEIAYIENHSLLRDISLLLQTIPAVIRGEGAR